MKSRIFNSAVPLTGGLMLCLPFAAQAQAVIEEVFVTATKGVSAGCSSVGVSDHRGPARQGADHNG